jgi:hypothetical protein
VGCSLRNLTAIEGYTTLVSDRSMLLLALGFTRGAVVEEDDAVGEGFGGEEFEADGAVARQRKTRNSKAETRRGKPHGRQRQKKK